MRGSTRISWKMFVVFQVDADADADGGKEETRGDDIQVD